MEENHQHHQNGPNETANPRYACYRSEEGARRRVRASQAQGLVTSLSESPWRGLDDLEAAFTRNASTTYQAMTDKISKINQA